MKLAWALRHPVEAASRLVRRLERHPGLPFGRGARARRLLREVLDDRRRALVVGPAHVVRQALPDAALDVVGTNPNDREVTVISEARNSGSLPRRWDCVVVTEATPPRERIVAATEACLPGGIVVVLATDDYTEPEPPGTEIELRTSSRKVNVVVRRVLG
jgi:hypothetical protein